MNQVKETLIGFLIGIGIYGLMIELFGIFFSGDVLSYTLGLVFGLAVAIFLMFHMAKTLDHALDLPEQQASKYTTRQSFIRMGIMLVALIVAIAIPGIHFIATILGLLGLKLGAHIAPTVLRRLYPEDFITPEEED